MAKRWTPEEDALLQEVYPHNSKANILIDIPKDWTTVCRRARKLNLHRDKTLIDEDRKIKGPRKDTWTEEEKTLLKDIYETGSKNFLLSKFSRSWQSIYLTAKSLNLKRDPEIIKREMIEGGKTAPIVDAWSQEDNDLLKKFYETDSKEDLQARFPGRTWEAIRYHSAPMGMKRKVGRNKNDSQLSALWKKPETQEKFRLTRLEKRGVEYPSQDPEVREKVRIRVQEKFSVNNVFQSEEIKEKIRETNIEKYGFPSPQQNKEVHQQTTETNIERYGVDNLFKRVDLVQ